MPKTAVFTDEEVKEVREAISYRIEYLDKYITENEPEGSDLTDTEREIARLEKADKKLRENDTDHKREEGEIKMPKYEIKAVATIEEQRLYTVEAESLEKALENYGPETHIAEEQVTMFLKTVSARELA